MHVCPKCGYKDALLVPEAAEILGVTDSTVRNFMFEGLLAGVEEERIPGGFRYWIPRESLKTPEVKARTALAKERAARKQVVGA